MAPYTAYRDAQTCLAWTHVVVETAPAEVVLGADCLEGCGVTTSYPSSRIYMLGAGSAPFSRS